MSGGTRVANGKLSHSWTFVGNKLFLAFVISCAYRGSNTSCLSEPKSEWSEQCVKKIFSPKFLKYLKLKDSRISIIFPWGFDIPNGFKQLQQLLNPRLALVLASFASRSRLNRLRIHDSKTRRMSNDTIQLSSCTSRMHESENDSQ